MASRAVVRFFAEQAGYVVGERWLGAYRLAKAEEHADENGWVVNWERDDDGAYMASKDGTQFQECYAAILRTLDDGRVLGSLGCILDPSREYMRVVAAELALEAMHEDSAAHSQQCLTCPACGAPFAGKDR